MAELFTLPKQVPIQSSGAPWAGAKAYFYRAGTTTDQAVYTDAACSVAHAQPVVADANGVFAPIYKNPAASYDYRLQLKQSDGTLIYDVDNIPRFTLTQAQIGALFYPRTTAEIAAGVTPTYYYYEPGDVRRYGAVGDDATDNATAFTNALAANSSVIIPAGTYRILSVVTCPVQGATVGGEGLAKIVVNSNNAFSVTADDVTFEGITFTSLKTTGSGADEAIRAYDVSGLNVERCNIGRLTINHRCTGSATEARSRVAFCNFNGDYDTANGSDFPNVIEFRGITDIEVIGNTFSCTNEWYRIVKVSCATGDTNPYNTGRSRRFIFSGNVLNISGDAAQQVIDLFASTEECVISGNVFTVGGSSVPLIVSTKPGALADSNSAFQNNVSVTNNVFRLGSGTATCLDLSGAWGLAWYSVLNKVLVSGNVIESDYAGTSPIISLKGWTDASATNNVIQRGLVQYGRSMLVGNNQRVTIESNHVTAGAVELIGNASTPAAESYGNQPESISVSRNVIDDFNAQGAISFQSITACEEILVHGNRLRNQTDTATVQGAVYFTSVSGVAYMSIADNRANLANTAKNIVSGSPTVTHRIEHDNSWNSAALTWDPASLADGAGETSASITCTGAALGDWVRVAAPYDLQDCTATAYVQATNTVEIRLQNESTGTRDLGSGSWRVTWGKG